MVVIDPEDGAGGCLERFPDEVAIPPLLVVALDGGPGRTARLPYDRLVANPEDVVVEL